ncbi:hypothetical protein SAZ11_58390 [Streptomyces sp. FXJ1.4098]|nr:hypothetical protein [Streptomyces sp. FXJ1.4098]
MLGSGQGSGEWHVIYRFDREESAQAWEYSLERARWATRAGSFIQETGVQRRAGLKNWFEGPVRPLPPPPKWKLWLVNLSAVFPPVLIFNVLVIPFLGDTNFLLRTLALCLGVTAMVTWLVMPRLQMLLKKWLYPPLQSIRGATSGWRRTARVRAGKGARTDRALAEAMDPAGRKARRQYRWTR